MILKVDAQRELNLVQRMEMFFRSEICLENKIGTEPNRIMPYHIRSYMNSRYYSILLWVDLEINSHQCPTLNLSHDVYVFTSFVQCPSPRGTSNILLYGWRRLGERKRQPSGRVQPYRPGSASYSKMGYTNFLPSQNCMLFELRSASIDILKATDMIYLELSTAQNSETLSRISVVSSQWCAIRIDYSFRNWSLKLPESSPTSTNWHRIRLHILATGQ
jgi:hypothetical protein